MNNKRQNSIGSGLIKDFFYFNINRWIIGATTLISLCIFLYFLSFRAITVFPSNGDFVFAYYNDSANGGKSEIIQYSLSDTAISLDFNLKQGFISPYVGFTVTPKQGAVVDLSHYNLVRLDIDSEKIKSIGFALYTLNPYEIQRVNSPDLCFYTNLDISSKKRNYTLTFDQLKAPDWWRDFHHVSTGENVKPDLSRVLHLNIGTAYTPELETKYSLRINSISFERDNSSLIQFLVLGELIILLLLFIVYYLKGKLTAHAEPVTISYKPIEVKNHTVQANGFLDYINSNFHENDLSLEQVSKFTGVNERRIASTIQESFGCNFKSYVNQIRITEAKRLFKESDLNIGEIAFKVGFNNQSHFNRVFKSIVGTSPSAFRENIN